MSAMEEGLEFLQANPKCSLRHVFRESNSFSDFSGQKARAERWSWDLEDAVPRCLSGFTLPGSIEFSSRFLYFLLGFSWVSRLLCCLALLHFPLFCFGALCCINPLIEKKEEGALLRQAKIE